MINITSVVFSLIVVGIVLYFFKNKKLLSFNSSQQHTKNLDMFAADLTVQAKQGSIDPVIGREEEINRVTQILTRRTKNNVILVGQPGVGKTAVVEGIAGRIASGDVPRVLSNKRVLLLQVAELLAGTKYRGEFEQRVKGIVQEIRNSNRSIILFIDEIHTITQTKGTEGAVNLSDILKPALARGDLQLIGATTQKEYELYIHPDESWDRRFQVVAVDEPSSKESIKILQGIKKNYEEFHEVKISDDAVRAAVSLSKKYIKGRRLPDKAIDIMDEAAAMVNVAKGSEHHPVAGILHAASKKSSEEKQTNISTVTVTHIKEVVAEWANIKITTIH